MESKENKMTKLAEGFLIDENGKIHAVPMKVPDWMKANSTGKSTDDKSSSVKRKFIPIERLVLTPADFGEPVENAPKRRKVERPIRKELFKVPKRIPEKRFSYSNRRSTTRNFIATNIKLSTQKKVIAKKKMEQINDGSPLLDVDEAEVLLSQKTLIHNPLKTVLFPLNTINELKIETTLDNRITPSKPLPAINNEETPSSTESTNAHMEFLEFEKILASAKKTYNKNETESPMSSMCTLLESTKIANSGTRHKSKNPVLGEIETILKHDEMQFQLLKKQFENYQSQRETNLNKIKDVIKQTREDKENSNRRSTRIAAQTTVKSKLIISPAISKSVDLRKSTLNKNLSKNLQDDSPRTRNAVNMYNTFRNDCSVLCTPKLNRTNIDFSQSSLRRSLSRRIQKQCLLLQDTPKPSS